MTMSICRKLGFIVVPFFTLACGDINLMKPTDPPVNAKSDGNFCISPPETKNRLTKIMFVMDKSGSNSSTDPGAVLRAGGVENFYNDHLNDEYIKWGMIQFGQVTDFVITDPYFTQDETAVRSAISVLRSSDGGSTPYSDALAKTELAIRDDIDTFPEEDAYYMVFFISDGRPEPYISVDQAKTLVQSIVNIKPGKIFLSSAYYGTNGTSAQEYLREMAIAGGGKYADLNLTGELDFEALIVRPTNEPWQIKNTTLMVYNTNASTCLDGSIGVDSDSDGMCDVDELEYGLNPQLRNSFPTITDEKGKTINLKGY
ncbi:MAG: VWA domain-containing protein, partial [Bdellovibrionales bacterium]|nr:VWA domain-containing protein [Bdellovibrionales bacterium]